MNFLSFCLTLGSRRFVLKHHVNKNIFKNKVGIGNMYANKQLLTQKKGMDYYRLFSHKLVWNKTQILSKNGKILRNVDFLNSLPS